jgi:hypothetical protein
MSMARRITVCALLVCSLLNSSQVYALESTLLQPELLPQPAQCSIFTENEGHQVDDLALELLLVEPKLCCLEYSAKMFPSNSLAGLLLWDRIRILCQNLRPTAIC